MIADRARCPVWELDDAPSWWVERIRLALVAENRAAEERAAIEERRRKMRQRMQGSASGGRRR